MSVVKISPEEQIRRVARTLLSISDRPELLDPAGRRADVRGLIEMIERHLHGELPPIAVSSDDESSAGLLPPESTPGW